MSDPPSQTKYTDECSICQLMISAHTTEILLFKMQTHVRENHNHSDGPSKKAEKVSAVERLFAEDRQSLRRDDNGGVARIWAQLEELEKKPEQGY